MRSVSLLVLFVMLSVAAGCDRQASGPEETPPAPAPSAVREPVPVTPKAETTAKETAPAPKAATQPAPATQVAPSAQAPSEPPSAPVVEIDTSMGLIVVELTRDRTPVTVDNFLRYVDEKFYDGTIFHRVMDGFMIQGGGLTANMEEKPTREPIINESDKALSNTPGTIAMARKNHPHSATSQFYINVGNNSGLDRYGGGYTVFGRVIAGMDVVNTIAKVPTEVRGEHEAWPREVVEIRSIRRR